VARETGTPRYPFDADPSALARDIERYVDVTFASLASFYLELPRGRAFTSYDSFRQAYLRLESNTSRFAQLDPTAVLRAVREDAMVLVVLRCILGLSPPELADLTTETQGVPVAQGFARAQDQRARSTPTLFRSMRPDTERRLAAMVKAACDAISKRTEGPSAPSETLIHRLDKIDTAQGLSSLQKVASSGVEYSALLYERLLGRPFASLRDSVSELVGDIVEDAVSLALTDAGVPFRKTGRAERIPGFDQAPDFLIPDANSPKAIIEAKLTQDDGTARDKITRVQHLDRLSDGGKKFEVIACIDGRGFRIRREDMKKLLLATRGKVFALATMNQLVEKTSLGALRQST